jgi:hypothetical protein
MKTASTAFSIGQYVVNQHTQHIGKVVGYGSRLDAEVRAEPAAASTVKVLVKHSNDAQRLGFIEEDVMTAWQQWPA